MRTRRVVAGAVLALLAACGAEDPGPPADPATAPTTAQPAPTLDAESLQEALLRPADVPDALAGRFRPSVDLGERGIEGAEVAEGSQACSDFVDEEYGPEEVASAATQLAARESETTISSVVRSYAPGEAEEQLAALLQTARTCKRFVADVQGTPLEVSLEAEELDGREGYDDLADDLPGPDAADVAGVLVTALFRLDGAVILEQRRTAVRVGDTITFSSALAPTGVDDEVMALLTRTAVRRLTDVLQGVGS